MTQIAVHLENYLRQRKQSVSFILKSNFFSEMPSMCNQFGITPNVWLTQVIQSVYWKNQSYEVLCDSSPNSSINFFIQQILFLHDTLDPNIKFLRQIISVMLCSLGLIGYLFILITLTEREFDSTSYVYHKALSWLELVLMIYTLMFRIMTFLAATDKSFSRSIFWLVNKSVGSIFFRHSISKIIDFVTFFITIDRFIAIRHPSKWRRFNRNCVAYGFIAASVILGCLLDIPEHFVFKIDHTKISLTPFKQSSLYWISRKIRVGIVFGFALATAFVTALIIIGFMKLKSDRARLIISRSISNIGQHNHASQNGANVSVSIHVSELSNPNNNNQLTVPQSNQLTVSSISGFVLQPQACNHELRTMKQLCYLLLALVVPYLVNQIFNVAYTVCHTEWKIFLTNIESYSITDCLNTVVTLQYCSIIFGLLLDVTNDFYHASNFYLYLLFSRRFRRSFKRKFYIFDIEPNIEFV